MEFDSVSVRESLVLTRSLYVLMLSRYTQVDFWRRCTFPKWDDWNIAYTSKGIAKVRQRKAIRLLTVALAIVGAYRIRQSGLGVQDAKDAMRGLVQGLLGRLVQLWTLVKSQVAL